MYELVKEARSENGYYYIASEHFRLKLRQRAAYPRTYSQTDRSHVVCGYGPDKPSAGDEFLRVTYDERDGLYIKRDLYCTLPLFYGFSEGIFVASNAYDAVMEALPSLTLNPEALRKTLRGIHTTHDVLWNEVGVLGEREMLSVQYGIMIKTEASQRPWQYNDQLAATDPYLFPHILDEALDRFTETRLRDATVGFEISGGLDSAILPLFLAARRHSLPRIAATKILPDPDRQPQLSKLNAIEVAAAIPTFRTTLGSQQDHPLVQVEEEGTLRHSFHPMHGLYEASTVRIAEHFQAAGISVAITGGGGDELFEHNVSPHAKRQLHSPAQRQDFWSHRCYAPPANHPMRNLLSVNVVAANIGHSNSYIERDIWPVSPFYDLRLFNFCQALPIQFRHQKRMLRIYAASHHYPHDLYEGPGESFNNFFNACMLSPHFAQLIETLSQGSLTEGLGFIDSKRLRRRYELIRRQLDTGSLFAYYCWLCCELNLRLAARTGQWVPSTDITHKQGRQRTIDQLIGQLSIATRLV